MSGVPRVLVAAGAAGALALAGCGSSAAGLHVAVGSSSSRVTVTTGVPVTVPGSGTEPAGTGTVGTGPGSVGSGTVGSGTVGSGTVGAGSVVTVGPSPQPVVPPTTIPGPTTTTAAPQPPPGTGIYGVVTAGPTCPVERAGQPCPTRPVSATVTAADEGGVARATTHTDAEGRYAISLPPGSYTVTASTGAALPRCTPAPATVAAGSATRADISCDTGIR